LGFPVWGGDTGGYLGEGRIEEELYIRWLQWGAWNGMFETKIDGSAGIGEDRPPWKYSIQLQNIYREVSQQRMELLPYIYSCINTSYEYGVVMKPLAYQYMTDEKTYSIWDEYIFGNAFLVAPVFTKNNTRTIYLPKGNWFAFNDVTKEYHGPATFTENVPLNVTPIFIKGNSIFITGKIFQGNSRIWENGGDVKKDVVIHLFPGQVNEQTNFLYVDYVDNDKEKAMLLKHHSDKIVFTSESLGTNSTIEIKCAAKPARILVNKKSAQFEYDETKNFARIQIEKNKAIDLEMHLSK
jgi:alpha-glucosidase (family GH31 glycosyl hydrolase)